MKTFKATFYRNRKKIVTITLSILLVLIILFTAFWGIPLMRRPKYIEGSIFDEDVSKMLYLKWLQKPTSVQDESFRSSYDEESKNCSYSYVFYTQEPLGDTYVTQLQAEFEKLHGEDLIVGTFNYDDDSLGSAGRFLVDGKGYFDYSDNPEVESSNDSEYDYERVTYSVIYTKYVKRMFVQRLFGFLDYVLCAMQPRYMNVTSYNVPSENGLYKTVMHVNVRRNEKEELNYSKEDKKTINKFTKII